MNSAVVDRPIDELWALLVDLFNAPRLPGGSMALRQTSPGPMGLGSTFEGRRLVLGFETRIREQVIEWDPPRVMGATIESRTFRVTERFTLEAGPGGTTCTDVLDIELRMPLKLIGPVIVPILRRQRAAHFRQTKAMLEAGFR
jgi:polyketide cyclase/dehydrase/lipid transport protein